VSLAAGLVSSQASLMEFIAAMHATIVVEKGTGEDLS
jgi:hypothetical protein